MTEGTVVVNLSDLLDEYFFGHHAPEVSDAEKLFYPDYRVKVAVVPDCPPRHERFEFMRDLGMMNIVRLFDGEPLKISDDGVVTFIFPERWMAKTEEQQFMLKIEENPAKPQIKEVHIATGSPLIVGEFVKEQIRIIKWPDDE